MPEAGIVWIEPPEKLIRALEEYGERARIAIHATACYVGAEMQNAARDGAPWQDRTGNARGGLFFAVDGFGLPAKSGDVQPGDAAAFERDKHLEAVQGGDADTLVLALSHSMGYGEHLELAHGQKYAIIMPTIERLAPELKRLLDELFR
jgi:hypothetical protein